MNKLLELQLATIAARSRTGDQSIATSAANDTIRIERVVYGAGGKSMVTPLSKALPFDAAVKALNALN